MALRLKDKEREQGEIKRNKKELELKRGRRIEEQKKT